MSPLEIAAKKLRGGDVVAIPTETVYGLAASIRQPLALEKVFQLKKRPYFDPLIVHVHSVDEAKSLVTLWPNSAEVLARHFWPGPLSLVLPKSDLVSDLITSGLDTVAIRCPRHPLTLDLIAHTGPLAAPSANLFGRTSPTTPQHVREEFGPELFILEGGPCEGGIESTVLQIERDDRLLILRPGLITADEIQNCLAKAGLKATVETRASHRSPGHLEHHYQPQTPLALIDADATMDDVLSWLKEKNIEIAKGDIFEIELATDPYLAARGLYSSLRSGDDKGKLLLIKKVRGADGGLWEALWDRLYRAATYNFCHR